MRLLVLVTAILISGFSLAAEEEEKGPWRKVDNALVTHFEKGEVYSKNVTELLLEPNSKEAWKRFQPLLSDSKPEGRSAGVASEGKFIVRCEPEKLGKNRCELFLYDAKPGSYNDVLKKIQTKKE